MGESFGWCFIGCGKIARRAADDFLHCAPGTHLATVYARNAERARAFAANYGAQACDTPEKAILAPDVRAVYVCTTNPSHKAYCLLALRLGKPVLCEKPVALDLPEAREVVETARKQGVYYMEGMWTRHLPAVRQALDWARQGAVGRLKSLSAVFAMSFPFDPTHRLFDPAQGGGAMLDIGVYTLALAHAVFGVMPEVAQAVTEWAPTGVDSAMACALRYPGGALARLYFSTDAMEPNDAFIVGESGRIVLPQPFWAARQACLYTADRADETFCGDHPGTGMQYEFDAARADIEAGRLENALVTHDMTLGVMALMDRLRA